MKANSLLGQLTALPSGNECSFRESFRVWVNECVVDFLYPPIDILPTFERPNVNTAHSKPRAITPQTSLSPFRG